MTRAAACLATLMAIAGCVSAPTVQRIPETVISDEQVHQARDAVAHWWRSLEDDELHQIITDGLASNPNAQVALARLAQAEADLKIAQSARWPSITAIGSRDVRKLSGSDPDTRSDLGSLNLGWDAGLWGKRRLEIEWSQQFREQRWFEHQSVALALSATIAETYYQIVELRTQGQLLAEQIAVSKSLERLIEARFKLGQAPANEIYQQREQTTVLEQLKLVNDTRQEVLEKSLDVLVGEVPNASPRVTRVEVPQTPDMYSGGDLNNLVRHRADIRAGYARLRQAAANAGIRFAERLPTLQVSASLTSLAQKSLSSEWFGYGLDLTAPLFAGGRLRALEDRALHALEEERQRYLELWLTALEQTRTLNWEYQQQRKIIAAVSSRRQYAQRALKAARDRYVLGDQNYLDVLTALRGLQEADRSLIAEKSQLVTLWIRASEAVGQPMCNDALDCQQHWAL